MNRINPLHLVSILLFALLFLTIQLSNAKNELKQTKVTYLEVITISSELKDFNEIYSDKRRIQKSLNTILKQASLKSAGITQQAKRSSIILNTQSINQAELNSVMAKLLNGSYNIASLRIKRLNAKNASFKVEIKW